MPTVRLFAALRDAADARTVEVAATTAASLFDELAERFGETMRQRLRTASLVVDGATVPRHDTETDLAAAEEVVLLPPFAGGG